MLQSYQPFTGVVRHLIIINVLVFIATYVLLGPEHRDPETFMLTDLGRMQLAVFPVLSPHFQPYQILTHMFMHGNFPHLAFNMISLYFFGPMVEMVWGHRRFLFYYLFCGLGAWALQAGIELWSAQQPGFNPLFWEIPTVGASGAIFGIFVAFAVLFPNAELRLFFPPIPIKAKFFVPIMAGIELFSGIGGYNTGIAHFAHLGGALFGFILILIWYKGRINNRRTF